MAYKTNPFLERRSDRTTSDQDFVGLFSPKILERLPEEVFKGGVHVFHSPPGGGKTTLLRAFSPGALRGVWNARKSDVMEETLERLQARSILDDDGPQMLGVMLSCAAGYADLPAGADFGPNGIFRALFDCRIVLRSLRGLALFLGYDQTDSLPEIQLQYGEIARDLKSIPLTQSATDLLAWAERTERQLYSRLDAFAITQGSELPAHVRFEGLLWLEGVRFVRDGREVAPKRLLMVDDLHKLRDAQRRLLVEELTELRPSIPIWLAQRSIALGPSLLSQGGRSGRDLSAHSLDELWSTGRGQQQFSAFAENILDRRMTQQSAIRSPSFRSHLRADLRDDELTGSLSRGVEAFRRYADPLRTDAQYTEWLERADTQAKHPSLDNVRELYKTRILMARNQRKRQMRLELAPLPSEELDSRESSKDENAAEIFMHEELNVPYFFGLDRISVLATNNVEEILQLAATLYEGLKTKQVLRHREPLLSPQEQEKLLKEAAKRKLQFIPKNHTQGTRAQRLLTAIGAFCREKTFEPNAPYAPGVTGVKLSESEFVRLERGEGPHGEAGKTLVQVLSECAAENLLVQKSSAATTGRDSGSVFYLNRTLCVHFGLPVQYGGWQEVDSDDLIEWMQRGPAPVRRQRLALE
jgi:hypothetical protein